MANKFELQTVSMPRALVDMEVLRGLVESMRPMQWSKNLVVFAALLFSKKFFYLPLLLESLLGFLAFCMISSSVYIVNDMVDAERDHLHPLKSLRPIASGRVSKPAAVVFEFILALAAFVVAYMVGMRFFVAMAVYFITMLSYCFYLKNFIMLDILVIAFGFLIRAVSGVFIIDTTVSPVAISPWLILCSFFLSLFLIVCKRKHEIAVLGINSEAYRQTLAGYTPRLLNQLVSVTTASTIICYALYTLSPRTVWFFGSRNLIYTLPIVIYGISRYLVLVYKNNKGSSPERLIWSDKLLLSSIVVWVLISMVIIYS